MKARLTLLAVAALAFLAGCSDSGTQIHADNLPWQIETHSDGTSTVMGIRLTEDTLLDAKRTLDARANIAMFGSPDGKRRIEAYYGEISLSGLRGKLISVVEATPEQLDTMEKLSHNPRPQPSGGVTRELEDKAFGMLKSCRVGALNFVPVADFTPELVRKYFGEPADTLEVDEQRSHWLYPDKGVAILVDTEERELFQYVAPKDFETLRETIVEGIEKG